LGKKWRRERCVVVVGRRLNRTVRPLPHAPLKTGPAVVPLGGQRYYRQPCFSNSFSRISFQVEFALAVVPPGVQR
jgi:hypothetical protein